MQETYLISLPTQRSLGRGGRGDPVALGGPAMFLEGWGRSCQPVSDPIL
ncbi:hypothetical protein AB205_0167360 [Aquarana catesbeiana]|uniref:Uncharacterized protein n=1 Tax=Aquarana catesbeiana TaxID=8400 RepID=A0A2G9S8G6_AQUCT|nr:hypothetical protein AB205_0167360 [Aquarana catesbeiana]